jgi:hypothetical protein
MSDQELEYPQWQGPYRAALSDSGSPELPAKIQAAEHAIYERSQILAHDSGHQAERQAIADALAVLRSLQRDKLSFPDWKE